MKYLFILSLFIGTTTQAQLPEGYRQGLITKTGIPEFYSFVAPGVFVSDKGKLDVYGDSLSALTVLIKAYQAQEKKLQACQERYFAALDVVELLNVYGCIPRSDMAAYEKAMRRLVKLDKNLSMKPFKP